MEKQFEYTEQGDYFLSNITGSRLKKVSKTTKLANEEFINQWLEKLNFEKLYKNRLKQINKKEPLVFEMIKKEKVKGCRVCYFKEKTGKEWINSVRFELVYENNTVIKVNEVLYLSCKDKLEDKHSNY